jgi:hypothetical protein
MAKFRCRVCGEEGTFVYHAGHKCCGARSIENPVRLQQRGLLDEETNPFRSKDPLLIASILRRR